VVLVVSLGYISGLGYLVLVLVLNFKEQVRAQTAQPELSGPEHLVNSL
jgi:hypothetical protein